MKNYEAIRILERRLPKRKKKIKFNLIKEITIHICLFKEIC